MATTGKSASQDGDGLKTHVVDLAAEHRRSEPRRRPFFAKALEGRRSLTNIGFSAETPLRRRYDAPVSLLLTLMWLAACGLTPALTQNAPLQPHHRPRGTVQPTDIIPISQRPARN